jgi:hypothetical protein
MMMKKVVSKSNLALHRPLENVRVCSIESNVNPIEFIKTLNSIFTGWKSRETRK